MAVKLAWNSLPAFLDGNGNPLSGGKLFCYVAGSTTKQTTYQDSGGITPHSNPIVLSSRGEPPAAVWLTTGVTYKFVLCPSTDTDPPGSPIWTVDNISGINDATVSQDQWISGPTPTYVSSTQFTLAGDKTTDFHVGRRLKSTITAGTGYHTITVSAYSTGTTTITVNGSALDSGLTAIAYGVLTAINPSIPDYAGGLTTGDYKLTIKIVADAGWVLMNDGTMGNAASGGTARANADTAALFTLLYNVTVDADCAVSGGRGASAAADYAANKTIALPKALGRSLACAGAGSGLTARALAKTIGTETHTLSTAEMPAHTHSLAGLTGNDTSTGLADTGGPYYKTTSLSTVTGSTGSGSAHNNMQPTAFFGNVMIKL